MAHRDADTTFDCPPDERGGTGKLRGEGQQPDSRPTIRDHPFEQTVIGRDHRRCRMTACIAGCRIEEWPLQMDAHNHERAKPAAPNGVIEGVDTGCQLRLGGVSSVVLKSTPA
jgi:hypothetical protein